MSAEQPTDWDMAHSMLIAVLMKLGGSIELDAADFRPDALGDAAGRFYSVEMEAASATTVRLKVVPHHETKRS